MQLPDTELLWKIAEKAYKAFDSTYQSKVTAIMNDGTKTDTQKSI